MSCVINDRIFALRNKMQENNIGIYIVPTNDYHSSEYVADYFKTREYITGFTGSAGVAVITMNEAGLWTDGRYFIQAEKELNGSEVTLYKFGLPGTPDIIEYVTSKIGENERVGFDGKCISADFASRLRKSLENKKVQAIGEFDLIGEIWDDRPQIIGNEIYELSAKYTGITRSEKIALVRAELIKNHADKLILTSLDEIAWMLNLRGSDIECNPVFFSYIILDAEKVDLFVLPDVISKELEEELNKDNVFVYNYYEFYNELDNLDGNIQLDKNVVNSYILDKFLNEKLNNRVDVRNFLLYEEYLRTIFGIEFSKEEINAIISKPGNIGRPELGKLLIKYGYADDQDEAFTKYLNPVMEECRHLKVGYSKEECIEMILEAGGIPVLAHPVSLKLSEEELRKELIYLKEIGLMGIETRHIHHKPEDTEMLERLADELDLLKTGGTDYHGENKPKVKLGTGINNNVNVTSSTLLDHLRERDKAKVKKIS